MEVKEFSIKVFLFEEIDLKQIGEKLGSLLTEVLCQDEGWKERHYDKSYKGYCFNYLYPLAVDGKYKKGGVYDFQCRVIDRKVEKILDERLQTFCNKNFKVLIVKKINVNKNRIIEKVFTTTPLLLKNEDGYWRKNKDIEFFENRIKNNLIKKYKFITEDQIVEPIIYNNLSIDNEKPIGVNLKGITLLGDKVTLLLSQDDLSQKIAYYALGMGVGENNVTLGAGFLNFKYQRK
ncbi:CRISPR-associated endoribonuclease Cas6 [Tissierella creatinini]|nr:CRISPR-associated endoribonuclease Cas6 [Tissierella creatinini]TJX64596.1 CRISPR-associated endoribonuclease Cas6 [Soehngenia saccharolytica]